MYKTQRGSLKSSVHSNVSKEKSEEMVLDTELQEGKAHHEECTGPAQQTGEYPRGWARLAHFRVPGDQTVLISCTAEKRETQILQVIESH